MLFLTFLLLLLSNYTNLLKGSAVGRTIAVLHPVGLHQCIDLNCNNGASAWHEEGLEVWGSSMLLSAA